MSFSGESPVGGGFSQDFRVDEGPVEQEERGSSQELWDWLGDGVRGGRGGFGGGGGGGFGGGGGGGGDRLCRRGGGSARLLRAAAPRTWEEDQQLHRGYLEDGYLQLPPTILSAPSETLYPFACCVPLAEDPPMDDTTRLFLCAVLSQARSCLPGLSATFKHGVTTPDEVLKFVMEQKGTSRLATETPATFSGSQKEVVLQNILFTIRACEVSEVMDAVLQLDYWLSTIKFVCLANK